MAQIQTVAFVAIGRPLTANKNVGAKGKAIQAAYKTAYLDANGQHSAALRYASIHHFVRKYNPSNDVDAGNISKRFLDALEGVAYDDDHVVRLVSSSIIEYGEDAKGVSVEQIDLSNVPENALLSILDQIDQDVPHFTYVELGKLEPSMIKFGFAQKEELQ